MLQIGSKKEIEEIYSSLDLNICKMCYRDDMSIEYCVEQIFN